MRKVYSTPQIMVEQVVIGKNRIMESSTDSSANPQNSAPQILNTLGGVAKRLYS